MREASAPRAGDWVKCRGFETIGFVKRVARDGTWADVRWRSWTKRMPCSVLEVQHTISMPGGWTVTDMDRERELKGGEPRG